MSSNVSLSRDIKFISVMDVRPGNHIVAYGEVKKSVMVNGELDIMFIFTDSSAPAQFGINEKTLVIV